MVHKCTHSNLAHSRGWGWEAFWICQLIGTARFLSNSRSFTSPWWLRSQLVMLNRSGKAKKSGRRTTSSSVLHHNLLTGLHSGVFMSTLILVLVLCASVLCQFCHLFSACVFISLHSHFSGCTSCGSIILTAGKF